jgi:hypothetical protein
MNLVISIFGGMLLTVLLYGATRAIKLSNFWAAIAAAGLPVLAYVIYAFRYWPGLDVVTLNVVAYPTVAVLLFQLYDNKPGKSVNVHWVPKLLIGFFIILTILLGSFVYVATHGLPQSLVATFLPNAKGKVVHTGFSGVVEHGEEAAKTIAAHRNIDDKLAKLGWNVEIDGLEALNHDHSQEVKVLLHLADGRGVSGQQVHLTLSRPGGVADAGVPLREIAPGDYRASVTLSDTGMWLALLHFSGAAKGVVLEHFIGHD